MDHKAHFVAVRIQHQNRFLPRIRFSPDVKVAQAVLGHREALIQVAMGRGDGLIFKTAGRFGVCQRLNSFTC